MKKYTADPEIFSELMFFLCGTDIIIQSFLDLSVNNPSFNRFFKILIHV